MKFSKEEIIKLLIGGVLVGLIVALVIFILNFLVYKVFIISIDNYLQIDKNKNNIAIIGVSFLIVLGIVIYIFIIKKSRLAYLSMVNFIFLFVTVLNYCFSWYGFIEVSIISFLLVLIYVFIKSENTKGFRTKIIKYWKLILTLIILLAIAGIIIYFYNQPKQDNLKEQIVRLEKLNTEYLARIDSLENLPPSFIDIPISNENEQGNIYIFFIQNDSINGRYVSPKGTTYSLLGKRIDSLYQGVMININNVTEENHFHFNINSNNQINGDFTIGKKTVHINNNIILNTLEQATTEPELPDPEKEKNPKKTTTSKRDSRQPPPRPESIKVDDIKYIYLGTITDNVWTTCFYSICNENEWFDINNILFTLTGSVENNFRLYSGKKSSLKDSYVSYDIELEAASSKIDTVPDGRNSYTCWMKMKVKK